MAHTEKTMKNEVQQAFSEHWKRVTAEPRISPKMNSLKVVEFEALWAQVFGDDPAFVPALVESIYLGDVYILRNAYAPEILTDLKRRVFSYGQSQAKGDHRMLDGCPNFVADYDYDASTKGGYGFTSVSYNFFRWNRDPLGVFQFADRPYRLMKAIAGVSPEAYVHNIPSDGTIDKLEVIHYPIGGGGIDMHSDPGNNVKLTMGINLTQKGIDYQTGGFEVVGPDGQVFNVEDEAPLGSIASFFPGLPHSVGAVDPGSVIDWTKPDGRWFVGITSVHSHMVEGRDKALPTPGFKAIHERVREAQSMAGAK